MLPSPRRLPIAHQMHLQLLRELGLGIDVDRMLSDARYTRDVLLVCDALRAQGLHELSARYREAEHEDETERPMSWAQDTSGFGMTLPPAVPPAPGVARRRVLTEPPLPEPPRRPAARARPWFSPGRWFRLR